MKSTPTGSHIRLLLKATRKMARRSDSWNSGFVNHAARVARPVMRELSIQWNMGIGYIVDDFKSQRDGSMGADESR